MSPHGSIYQTHDLDQEIEITPHKANKKKYEAQFQINIMLNDGVKTNQLEKVA